MLKFLKLSCHPLVDCLPVCVLGASLCCSYNDPCRSVSQSHPRFDFIAVLPTRPAGDKELFIAILLK